jgi:hypothetical protein
LAQRDPITNKTYVCEFYGKALTKSQSLWPITQLEMYAVTSSFAKWHNYLIGNHVTVYTDHNALIHMEKMQTGPPRLQRWAIFLSQYDYEIVYRKGAKNLCADALSRRAYDMPTTDDGDDIDFLNHINEEPITENDKVKGKNRISQLITFETGTVETINALSGTELNETVNTESIEPKPSVNAITQTDSVPLDTIMGGKYDIKLLQAEDSDFKNVVSYLKDGILDSDDTIALETILEAENYSWSPTEGLHRMWIPR